MQLANGPDSSGATVENDWVLDTLYQSILMRTGAIVFANDQDTGKQFVSPYVSEYLSGNYDDRLFSDVLLQDQVIHPADREKLLVFREHMHAFCCIRDITIRLRCNTGLFRWYRLSVNSYEDDEKRHVTMGILTDVDEEVRLRDSLRYQAEFDATSGIYNKQTFFRETERLLRANPEKTYQLVRFDIDRFKTVNELYSTSEGDRVLREIGRILRSVSKPEEIYARLGNDVFGFCIARSAQETVRLLEQIDQSLNEYPLDFEFVLSCGIFTIHSYQGQPINVLCDRAALAQRTVKGNYVHRIAFYEEWMGNALNREHYIIGSMSHALSQGQFIIYLQPKYEMATSSVFGAEALVRWKHPRDGLISPGEFIPLFERNGFILKLDEYVWELACKTLRGWIDKGMSPVPVSVNVSRLHLYDPGFCEKVVSLVNKYHLPPNLLELEITESAYTEDSKTLYSIMERLQKAGFAFSMDDFGSGYSSLNVLKDIPVNILKIDLNFLKESRRGKTTGRTILEAMIHMTHQLELPVVVEGVETAEQVDVLMEAGCTKAQGYYFQRPMPVEDFERLLRNQLPGGSSADR